MESKCNYNYSFISAIQNRLNFSKTDIESYMEYIENATNSYIKSLNFLNTDSFKTEVCGVVEEDNEPFVSVSIKTDFKTYTFSESFFELASNVSHFIDIFSHYKQYFDKIFNNISGRIIKFDILYGDLQCLLNNPSFVYSNFSEFTIEYDDIHIPVIRKNNKVIFNFNISKIGKDYLINIIKFIGRTKSIINDRELVFYGLEGCNIVKTKYGIIINDLNCPDIKEALYEIQQCKNYNFRYNSRNVSYLFKNGKLINLRLTDGHYSVKITDNVLSDFSLSKELLNIILEFDQLFNFNEFINKLNCNSKETSNINTEDILNYNILKGYKILPRFSHDISEILTLSRLSRLIDNRYVLKNGYVLSQNTVCIDYLEYSLNDSLSKWFKTYIFNENAVHPIFSNIHYKIFFSDGVVEKKDKCIKIIYNYDFIKNEETFNIIKKVLREYNKEILLYDRLNNYIYLPKLNKLIKERWYNIEF